MFLLASSANAVIIDFEEIDNTGGNAFSGSSLDTQGFNLSNSAGSAYAILHWGLGDSFNADVDGVTYSHNYGGSTSTLTQLGGGAFDLNSIDFGNVYNNRPYAQEFEVNGFYEAGGGISTTLTSDEFAGLETFTFNWEGLSSVTWTEISGTWLQLDNIVLNASVPEPSTLALFGLGLLGLSLSRKKKAA